MSLSDLMQLIPAIEIGKKYLWREKPTEDACPRCGNVTGQAVNVPEIVTVSQLLLGDQAECESCHLKRPFTEGWYGVEDKYGNRWAVPYTQLEEIQEESR